MVYDEIMKTHTGLLTHITVFKEKPYVITGMLIWEDDVCINCVIKNRPFAKYILSLPMHQYEVEVKGNYNSKGQLNVKHMRIVNIDSYISLIGTPE